jgi:hypothetical protein
MTGYIIKCDGTITPAAEKLDMQGMYAAIGCTMVERVQLAQCELWCDDEGLLTGTPINEIATRLYQREHGPQVGIVGDVYARVRSGYALDASGAIVKVGGKQASPDAAKRAAKRTAKRAAKIAAFDRMLRGG